MGTEASSSTPVASEVYVFENIRSSQAQHGLKHGDYTRYRQYCARRLSKLRTQVKFHHGRNRFQKKELKIEMIVDERWLEMLLLEAERAWASALEIKAEMDKDGYVHTNKRRHMLRRFAKARQHALFLRQGCAQIGTTRRQAEAAAYADWLAGLELFEKGRQVEEAAGYLVRARRALEALSGIGPATSQSACRQKASEIDSVLRLAMHRASQGAGSTVTEGSVELPRDATLESNIAAVSSTASVITQADSSSFAWRGNDFKVQDTAIQVELVRVEELTEQMEAAMDTDDSAAHQQRLKLHDDTITALTRAKLLLQDSTEASSSGTKEGLDGDAQHSLLAAVSGALVEAILLRYTIQAHTLNGRFKRNMAKALSKAKDREKGARAEDCVRLYDGLVKASLDLEAVTSMQGITPSAAEDLVVRSEVYTTLYSAVRCYYIAHLRLGRNTVDDFTAAQALFATVGGRIQGAMDASQGLAGGMPAEQRDLADFVTTEAAAYTLVSQAEVAACLANEDGKLAGGIHGMKLEEGPAGSATAGTANGYLASQMQEWKPCVGASITQARIFKVASLLETIPMRPITLDTALQYIAEPDISHRCREKASNAAEPVTAMASFKSLFGFGAR